MQIVQNGSVHTISTEDSVSEIEVFQGTGGTFVIEQLAGVANIRQTSLTKQEMYEFGAFLINLANGDR